MISAQLLGGACLRSGETIINGPPAQRHRIALLTMIVSAWPQPLSRDRAMAMLWPERDTAASRRLLNLAVHVLRAATGDDAIVSASDGLVLNPAHLSCDLHDLRAAIASGDAERIVSIHTGTLLDGFHLPESNEFEFWLEQRRVEIDQAYVSALQAVAANHQRSGDAQGTVRTYRRLVGADPHSPVYAQSLMRALDDAGDRAGAIRHASEHAHRLKVDLDFNPHPDVTALAKELANAPPKREAAPRPPEREVSTSVAVLPFLNLSADPDNEYFADGITEDVIAHLSKVRALRVTSLTSVMPFKKRQKNSREIGAALGVRTLLDGSVRRYGDSVRIVAKLIDTASDQHLWAETYDRKLNDIFAIQTDVALKISLALRTELSPEEKTRVARAPTNDVQAYQIFLKGRQWFIEYTPDSFKRAADLFARAIARDSSFAQAWANLALLYIESAEQGYLEPKSAFAKGEEAVDTALRLDPELSAAHCAAGYLKNVRDFDWSGAESSFKRALELSPSNSDAYDLYGRFCSGLGRYDEALEMQRNAYELDPLAHRTDMVTTLLRAGRYSEAIAPSEAASELDPVHARAHATLGWAYFLNGRQDEGIASLERASSLSKESTLWLSQLGEAYGLAGKTTKARAVLRDLERRSEAGFVSPYHFAYVYTGLGELDRAMDWLEEAVANRTGPAYGIKGSFLLSRLHLHPRFHALLKTMNLSGPASNSSSPEIHSSPGPRTTG